MKFQDWYANNELKIQSMARFTTNPYKLMEFAWDERGKLDEEILIQWAKDIADKTTNSSPIHIPEDKP
jgi:hypothetical protein